jgi:hypothetical protein
MTVSKARVDKRGFFIGVTHALSRHLPLELSVFLAGRASNFPDKEGRIWRDTVAISNPGDDWEAAYRQHRVLDGKSVALTLNDDAREETIEEAQGAICLISAG